MVHGTNASEVPVFIWKRSCNLFYDHKRFTDAALNVSRIDEDDLRIQLSSMPIDTYIDSIPESLLLLDALYSRFSLIAKDQSDFPVAVLKPAKLIRQLIWFLTRELDPGSNRRRSADWRLVAPRLRNLLRVVHFACPALRRELNLEKCEMEKSLERLGLHGLINCGDRNLIEIGEAVKHELFEHYHRVKMLSQQIEKLLQKMPYNECGTNGSIMVTYSINDLGGPVPSRSSHQRLMNHRFSEIKARLRRNECMLQMVENCLRNNELESLERILRKRIHYDRDIISQFSFLTQRNATYALASEDPVISHVLVLFKTAYDRLFTFMPRSIDDSGVGEEKSSFVAGNGNALKSSLSSGSANENETQGINHLITPERPRSRRYRRTVSSSQISHDSNGSRALNKPEIPTLSIFCASSSLSNNRASRDSTPLVSNNDRFYSSLPSLIDGPVKKGNTVDCDLDHNCASEIRRLRSQINELNMALDKSKKQSEISRFSNGQKWMNERKILHLVEHYGELYSNDRKQTMLELDKLPELRGAEELQMKILLSVIVLSFRFVWQELHKMKEDVWRVMHEPKSVHEVERDNSPGAQFLQHLNEYLLEKAHVDNYQKTSMQVSHQLYETLYEFPSLETCERLNEFINDCSSTAWQLSTLRPYHTIEFDDQEFTVERHMRFHTSDLKANKIQRYLWPALIDSITRKCLYRAVVIT